MKTKHLLGSPIRPKMEFSGDGSFDKTPKTMNRRPSGAPSTPELHALQAGFREHQRVNATLEARLRQSNAALDAMNAPRPTAEAQRLSPIRAAPFHRQPTNNIGWRAEAAGEDSLSDADLSLYQALIADTNDVEDVVHKYNRGERAPGSATEVQGPSIRFSSPTPKRPGNAAAPLDEASANQILADRGQRKSRRVPLPSPVMTPIKTTAAPSPSRQPGRGAAGYEGSSRHVSPAVRYDRSPRRGSPLGKRDNAPLLHPESYRAGVRVVHDAANYSAVSVLSDTKKGDDGMDFVRVPSPKARSNGHRDLDAANVSLEDINRVSDYGVHPIEPKSDENGSVLQRDQSPYRLPGQMSQQQQQQQYHMSPGNAEAGDYFYEGSPRHRTPGVAPPPPPPMEHIQPQPPLQQQPGSLKQKRHDTPKKKVQYQLEDDDSSSYTYTYTDGEGDTSTQWTSDDETESTAAPPPSKRKPAAASQRPPLPPTVKQGSYQAAPPVRRSVSPLIAAPADVIPPAEFRRILTGEWLPKNSQSPHRSTSPLQVVVQPVVHSRSLDIGAPPVTRPPPKVATPREEEPKPRQLPPEEPKIKPRCFCY